MTFFISWMILDALGCSWMLLDIIYSVDAQIMLRWCSVDVQMLWRFDARMLWCSWMLLVLLVLLALGCSSMLLDALGCSLMLLDASWILCIGKSFASKHLSIWGSEHLNIWPFEHLSIWALKHLNIWAIEHFNIWSSDHLSIWASEHHILLKLDARMNSDLAVIFYVWSDSLKGSLLEQRLAPLFQPFFYKDSWNRFLFQVSFSKFKIDWCLNIFYSIIMYLFYRHLSHSIWALKHLKNMWLHNWATEHYALMLDCLIKFSMFWCDSLEGSLLEQRLLQTLIT